MKTHQEKEHVENEKGTVLLTTLLIMAVMAAVSVAIMDDIRFAVKRVINVGDYAQADWYVKGGEDFAQSYITDRLASLPPDAQNQLFQTPQIFSFPFEGGLMTLNVRDGSNCFALGSLVTIDGQPDAASGQQFVGLLGSLGWPDNEARNLVTVATDWIDRDTQRAPNGAEDGDYLRREPPHRTANVAFESVMELRGIEGMTEELYQSIRPYLCAGPAGTKTAFNINTATPIDAPLLAALIARSEYSEYFDVALRLISERPPEGYPEDINFDELPALQGIDPSPDYGAIDFRPQRLWVEVRVDYLKASRLMSYEYDMLDNGGANLTYRGWGTESLRPTIQKAEEK